MLGNVESVARDAIRRAVAAVVFEEPVPSPTALALADTPPDALAGLAGVYAFGPSFRVSVRVEDGRLLARANKGGSSELVSTTDGMWFSRMLYATVRFERDASGRAARLLWGAGDGAPVGERID